MSDFNFNATLSRSDLSRALLENDECTMWVLADISMHVDALDLVEHIDTMDEDPEGVADYFETLAEAIRAAVEQAAAENDETEDA